MLHRLCTLLLVGVFALSVGSCSTTAIPVQWGEPAAVDAASGQPIPPQARRARRLSSDWLTSGKRVREAVAQAVEQVSRATVRVLDATGQVALGAVVDRDGQILTKASELPREPRVRLHDGRVLPATVLGVDNNHDLALVSVDADDLEPVPWADEETELAVGQWVVTPDSGQGEPVALGVVSVLPRRIYGEYGVLGVVLSDGEATGARINQVVPESGAEKAGLQVDDVIVRAADREVTDRESLLKVLREHKPGQRIQLVVEREQSKVEVEATLGQRRAPTGRLNQQNRSAGAVSSRSTGFPTALQHDTVLQPDQCGGPLVGLDGKAIGINIARAGRTESYAIPAKTVRELVEKLREK